MTALEKNPARKLAELPLAVAPRTYGPPWNPTCFVSSVLRDERTASPMYQIITSRKMVTFLGLTLAAVLLLAGCASPADRKAKFMETGKRLLAKNDFQRALLQFRNADQLAPNDAETYYQISLAYLGLRADQDAVAALKRAESLDPAHLPTQLKLAELMTTSSARSVLEDARKRVEKILTTSPDNAEALVTLAVVKLRLGTPDGVEQDLRKALRKDPAYFRASITLARLMLAGKDVPAAERVLQEARRKDAKSLVPAMALGEFYLGLKRYPEAETQYQQAVRLDSRNAAALVALGHVQVASGKKDMADQTYRKVVALPGSEYKTAHAAFLIGEGKTDAAVAELKDLMSKDPKTRSVRKLLVATYLSTNRIPDAAKVLSDVLAKNPKDIDALLDRAKIRIIARQYSDAQKDLLPVLRLQPDFAQAHHLLAKVYQAQGVMGSYRQELDEAIRRDPSYLNARIELATVLIAGNAAKAAQDLLDQAPPPQKNSIQVIVLRNAALMGLGQWNEAEKGIASGLRIARVPALLVQEGILKTQRKDYAGARKIVEEALTRDPENFRALETLVDSYRAQGQAAAGLRRIQEHAAQHPKSAQIQQFLGVLFVASGRRTDARNAFLQAKAAAPNDISVDLSLAQLDMVENKMDDARKTLSALLSKNSSNSAARVMLAGAEVQTGDFPAAIDQYQKALESDARNALVLNNLAFVMADRANQADDALAYAMKAKELAPSNPAIDDTIGWVYYRKGLYQEAVKYLEVGASKQSSAQRKYHLAMTYLKLGDTKRGAALMAQALKMDPKLVDVPTGGATANASRGSANR